MSVSLRDRVFSDTGGAVAGATVQAILVTGGGTDVGTSSAVVSTTTTDVNGMWKFTALADAGAGNWYDVKITNGNQIRWRYGNIQSVISQLLLTTTVALTTLSVSGLSTFNGNVLVTAASTTNAAGLILGTSVSSSASLGGATALPATPSQYLTIGLGVSSYKIPLYNP